MRFLTVAAMAALLCIPAVGLAQTGGAVPSADCGDDSGANRCDPEQQAKTRALFGAKTIEQFDAEGAQVLRAFFVDGYGRDEAHVALIRPKGGDAELIVILPDKDAASRQTMRTLLPVAACRPRPLF